MEMDSYSKKFNESLGIGRIGAQDGNTLKAKSYTPTNKDPVIPKSMSVLEGKENDLSDALSELSKMVEELSMRLEPVMEPIVETSTGPTGSTTDCDTPNESKIVKEYAKNLSVTSLRILDSAERLNTYKIRVDNIRSAITRLIQRLEV